MKRGDSVKTKDEYTVAILCSDMSDEEKISYLKILNLIGNYSEEQLEVLYDFRFNDMKEKSFGMLNFLVADIIDKYKGMEVDDSRLREYVTILNRFITKRNEELIKLDSTNFSIIEGNLVNDDKLELIGSVYMVAGHKMPRI